MKLLTIQLYRDLLTKKPNWLEAISAVEVIEANQKPLQSQ